MTSVFRLQPRDRDEERVKDIQQGLVSQRQHQCLESRFSSHEGLCSFDLRSKLASNDDDLISKLASNDDDLRSKLASNDDANPHLQNYFNSKHFNYLVAVMSPYRITESLK